MHSEVEESNEEIIARQVKQIIALMAEIERLNTVNHNLSEYATTLDNAIRNFMDNTSEDHRTDRNQIRYYRGVFSLLLKKH